MKGHLNAKQLEKYNREDLEKLATELGVSTEGTKKDIAARCAEIEVELPDADGQPASDLVKVACIQNYKDLQFNRIVETGEEYEVTPERAALLLEKKLVKRA
jgi:hypothetical protein